MKHKRRAVGPDYEYDHIALDVKREKAERFRRCCEEFGWEQEERRADRRYADIVHLRFRRPHVVAHKDALQLLQVRMEIAWNTVGRCESALSHRAAVYTALSCLASVCLLAAGIAVLCLYWTALWAKATGFVLIAIGALSALKDIFLCRNIVGKGRRMNRERIDSARAEIDALCARARTLRGVPQSDAAGQPQGTTKLPAGGGACHE